MLFSSVPFLFYFLPLVIAVYFAAPKKWRNFVLLIFSLFFYWYGEYARTWLMIVACVSSYIHGLLIDKFRGTKWAKVFMISSLITSLGILGLFKYADFFIRNTNALFGTNIRLLRLVLPIGISFYTFQTLSYTIDVYRGEAEVQKDLVSLSTYVTLFPQLIAGPIVRYTDIERELKHREHSFEKFAVGVRRFTVGLGKKILIANVLGELCEIFRETSDKSVVFFWMYGIAFCLHIYFDFSGYSDMAIGLGKMFAFEFLENFNYPYISKTVTEFWRRWHMSLGSWFRDYVYIPMGGNRVPKGRWFINILTVWFLTGFWHGADWTFIVWGLYFAFFLLIEKLFLSKLLDKLPKVLRHIYVLFVVLISFVIFNANGLSMAISDIGGLFGAGGIPFYNEITGYYLSSYGAVILMAIVGATPVVKTVAEKITGGEGFGRKLSSVLEPAVIMGILVLITAYLVDGSFNPFLYFRF